jgi:DNA mismatch repair protein MutS
LNLSDLNIESEIIPFFDSSLNQHSREALALLFHTIPRSMSEALARQQVISGFTANLGKIKNLHSYKRDIEEAYDFCCRLERQRPDYGSNLLDFKITLFFSRKKREQQLSKSIQLLRLFEKIYHHYCSHLDINQFPVAYKSSIRKIIDTIGVFEKEWSLLIKKGNNLSISEVAAFMDRLYALFKSGQLLKCWSEFFLFEAYLSIAVTAQKANLVPAHFIDKGIHLTNFFHPFIKHPVKNSIHLEKNVLVLTGPNMSGKSTLLRSISLCIYMARLGLPVPAAECQVVFASAINVFINSRDKPNSGYSHFMTEILHLKESIIAAGEGGEVFAVFDELFSGTNVDDALNLLTLTLNGLKKFSNSYFLLSTHFYKLKELSVDKLSHAAFYYIDSRLEEGKPKFTYELKAGWSDVKFGTILFEREGLTELLK